MTNYDLVREQTLGLRAMTEKLLREIPAAKADLLPPTWKNSARWHAGHLVVTPQMLTHGVSGEPLGVPAEYRTWFGKGSSPAEWTGQPVPGFDALVGNLVPATEQLFARFQPRWDEPFANPYTTSLGVVLRTPGEALNFSLAHDGIHLGLILALRRALAAL
jgi:hypothetical protein